MVNYCVYGGCTNCSQSGHRVHRFPDKKKHGDIFSAWVRFVQAKRRNFTSASATKNAVVCSVHFTPEDYRPEDIMEVNMGCKSKNQVRLRVDAVPSVHIASSSGHPSAARRHVGHKWPNFVLKRVTSGPSQSTETVSPLGSTSVAVARLVIMASEDSIEQLPGVAAGSDVKPDAVESCLLAATEAGENEPSLQNSIMETQKVEQEEVEKLPEEMKEDPDVIQQSGVDQQKGPEKNSVTEKKVVEENCAQDHSEQKNAGEVKKKEVRNNAEDAAHCSEELVIAKVEDFTSEMAIDVDQAEDCDGKMEVDASDDAGKSLPEPIKREKTEPPVVQTLSVLKTEVNPQVARLSDALSVKVKDEPMDEEYEKASVSLRPVGNIKDEPDPAAEVNQTPDSIKISAVFSVGGNATSIVPPAAPAKVPTLVPTLSLPSLTPANPIGVVCTGCNKVLLKGQTAFQRKGCPKLYCSPQCLCTTSNVVVKLPQKKQCHHCHKDILDLKDVINAPVDMSGTVKEFCSQKCLSALSFKCSVCHKTGMTYTHEVNLMGSVHKLCSNSCFNQFRSSNKLNMNSCINCGGYCSGTDSQCPSLLIESSVMKFCKQNCLVAFKKKSLKPVSCKICHTMRPVAEMVESPNMQGVKELFCSSSCVTANKVQTVSSSGVPVECNSCKLKLTPQYHLAMSDGTIQNFCSFSCVVSYQESFSKIKPVMAINTATSTSNNTPTTKPHAPKRPAESSSPAKTSTSSGPPQTATKIPCSQCLKSFYHRPELLEFKRKMYAFCDNSCVEEFKQINNIMARCEYCKIDKVVKEVKRINKIDRSFCSEGCKLLYKHDLVKRWGKKHCRNCYYCSGSAQALVTEVIDMVEQEFCGNICLSQHRLLMRKEIKCSMCRQAKKMTETVKWLGEIKHFCSLQCLMFFCSLQGTTGPVRPANKTLSTQGTSPEPSPGPQTTVNHTQLVTKEAAPVIASVLSLSSASNGQPGVLGSRVLQASVPAATAKGSGNTASTQTDGAKFFAPAPRILKNKALLCKPLSQNKGTSCKPNVCDMNTQTDGPSVIVLPVPVPIYVPLPMNLYTQYTPKSVGLPLPVPVPLFFPTTLDSAERIVKTIQEIKEKIPDDPLEADLIMMAEMVAEDAEKEKSIIITDQTSNIMDDLDLEALSSNLSWEEDSVSSAQTWDQTPEPERPPPPGSATLTPVSTAAEEPQMDLEADFPIERIELFREPTQTETTDSVKRRSRKRKHDGFPQKKRAVSPTCTFLSVELSSLQVSSSGQQGQNVVEDLNPELAKRDAMIEGLKMELRHCKEVYDITKSALGDLKGSHKGLVEAHRAVVLQLRESQVTTETLRSKLDSAQSPMVDSKSEDAVAQCSDADSQQIEPCCHPDLEIRLPSEKQLELLFTQSRRRPDRFGCLLFRAVLPQRKYKEWASNTNWDGARGKFALPVNLRRFIIKSVSQRFPCLTSSDRKCIKDRVNEFLRSPRNNGRKSATVVPVKSALDNLSNLSKLQHEYAVNAWKEWVRWRNAQPNMETPKFGSRSMTLKEDLLKCCTAEISYGLCKFISEVRRPNGEKYSPDSIFYLCLGIQQYLFDNNRMENIFADVFYTKFCQELTNILRGWKPTILPSGYVHSRVEEEYLWDCKQLGAFSPGVLLNTLLYFFTKYFNYKTVEQHRRLSFGHIVRCSRTKGNTKVACLRFYPPKEEASTDGVPAKKRKEEEDENDTVYEIKENADNPLRCPVRLYEFYLSKCSPSVRQRTTEFYLSPERSCVPNSPMWFSTTSLSDDVLDSMLTRILTVRELHLERETSPNESDSESDSDIRP
ncbi:zinc finger MYM-type protein 4 isoform X3 [Carassius gibelio]|uniref:zinc finger MYM-type protein 4 isoform X3 n=1 Tax=Carassius gibelio TaxID=101364 RepID=UPI002277DA57|nr:zinc finger MYM-type protein 4 isoform X3 [Carassius gibelio]